jgi:hypothetical protein
MSDETDDTLLPFAGLGSVAVVGGVVCCMGLKLIGGAALFGGLAATVGLTTDITTFVVGAIGGLLLAAFVVGYRRSGVDIRSG